jgi:dTDP-4-dehydrorhamnose reductase
VEACELNPDLAWSVNVVGAENLAKIAARLNSELLHFSTNYVFDGQRQDREFYTFADDPTPINVYGKTKLAGERAIQAIWPKSYIVRTSWVFGFGKENFFCRTPLFLKQGQKVRAITDTWANSTYLPDLIARVAEIISRQHYGLYHVVNNGVCSYYEFAMEAGRRLKIGEKDLENLIEAIKHSELESIADRPLFTPMRCLLSEQIGLAPIRDWQSALAEYIFRNCP